MKRILSLLLTLAMLLTSMPVVALSEGEPEATQTQQTAAPQEVQAPETAPTEVAVADATEAPPAVSEQPTEEPTAEPTAEPAEEPTEEPTQEPTAPPAQDAPTVGTAALVAGDSALAFDALVAGYETASPLTFTLRNTGDGDAELTYSKLSAFSVDGAARLAAGESMTVTVSPVMGLAAGDYNETLSIAADGSEASVNLSLAVVETAGDKAAVDETLAIDAYTPLPAPTDFMAEAVDYNAVQLSWTDVDGATKYRLTYSTALRGAYTFLADVTVGTSYLARSSSIICGTTYYFKICAYSDDAEPGLLSDPVSAKPLPIAPEGLSARTLSMQSNRISWTANTTGTTGYMIYVSTEVDVLSFTYLATIPYRSATYYDHTGLVPGTTYYYRIKAYYTVNGVNQIGYLSDAYVRATPELPAVTNFTAAATSASSIRLKWSRQSSVTGYTVTRRLVRGGNISATFDIPLNTTVTMDDTGLRVGTTYYYTIEPYYMVNFAPVYGPPTEAQGEPLPMAPTTITAASAAFDKISVSWSSVFDADGYCIYRRDLDDAGDFTYIDFTEATSYTDDNAGTGLVTGNAYEYKVSSYCISVGTNVEGDKSLKSALARPKPEQVRDVEVQADTFSSLLVLWAATDGAEEYIVECSTASTFPASMTTKVTTSDILYTFTGLTCGRLYYFRVTGTVTDSAGEITKGKTSSTVSQRPLPATPATLSASYTSSSSVRLSWDPISEGASGYLVYRSSSQDTGYVQIGKVASRTLLYYIDAGLVTAQTYYYKVCPYIVYSSSVFKGDFTDFVSIKALPGKPVIAAVASAGSTSLKVSWGKVSGATGYILSYATSEGGPYTTIDIASGLATSYTMVDLVETQRTIYVKLQAYVRYVDSADYIEKVEVGEESDVATGFALPGKVGGIKVAPSDDNSMTITWTPLQTLGNVAEGYYVYRCTKTGEIEDGPFEIKDGTVGTYTDLDLDVGNYYYYYVTAYAAGTTDPWVEGPISDIRGALIAPNVPKNFAVTCYGYNSLQLTWDAATSADGYDLFYSLDNRSFRLLTSINDGSETEYIHLGVTPGRKYYYRMRAFYHPSGSSTSYLFSAYTDTLSLASKPLPPTDVAVAVDTLTGYPKLTWTQAEGATGYLVYYDVDPDGAFSSYRTVSTNATGYTISGLTVGRTYYFKVKSRVIYSSSTVTSDDYSNMVNITVAPAAPKAPTATMISYNSVKLSWPSVSGAAGYYLYVRSDTDGADYTMRIQVTGATSKIITDDTISGQYLNYTVSAYCYEYDTATELEGVESASTRARVCLSAPSYILATNIDTTTVALSWASVAGAAGYRLSRKLPGETEYTELALLRSPDDRSYTDSTLASVVSVGDKVYYHVEAWIEKDEIEGFGTPTYGKYVYRLPPMPENLTADVTGDFSSHIYRSIDLAWDPIDWDLATTVKAYGFQLQRSVNSTVSYVTISTLNGETDTYTNTSLRTGTSYYYRLRTYIKIGSSVYYSPYSNVAYAKPELDKIDDMTAVALGGGRIGLEWTGVSGTSGIYLYRKAGTGAFIRLPALKAGTVTFRDTRRTKDVVYQYKIAPYVNYSGRIVVGPLSDAVEVTAE